MLEKGNDDWDNDSWELSNWFMNVASTVKPHSYSQRVSWAKAAHDIWQKNGTTPEELRLKTKPNWQKDLQIYSLQHFQYQSRLHEGGIPQVIVLSANQS